MRGIHRSPVNSPHKGQWRGALMFSLICVWINGWVNSREAGDLRRYRAHYDVNVMVRAWMRTTSIRKPWDVITSWRRHQVETFSALLAICAGNSPVPGEFPSQRPVTRSFDVFFDMRLNKRLSKQSWGWWFETLSRPLWRHCSLTILSPNRTKSSRHQWLTTFDQLAPRITPHWNLNSHFTVCRTKYNWTQCV